MERIAGSDRIETACKIAMKFKKVDTVLLARSDIYPDALAGVPLAAELNAPILLTPPTYLDQRTANTIQNLEAYEVIILGGSAAIFPAVENQLKNMGLNVERIGGKDRYDTAALIAKKLHDDYGYARIVLVTGKNFPDALAAAPYAATSRAAILFTDPSYLPSATKNAIKNLVSPSTGHSDYQVVIIGGSPAVSTSVENELKKMGLYVSRITGADRYETCINVAKRFIDWPLFTMKFIFTTGENWPDALAGGAFASYDAAAIILVRPTEIPQVVYNCLTTMERSVAKGYILGSEVAVSQAVESEIRRILN